jgi:hypothetical protein
MSRNLKLEQRSTVNMIARGFDVMMSQVGWCSSRAAQIFWEVCDTMRCGRGQGTDCRLPAWGLPELLFVHNRELHHHHGSAADSAMAQTSDVHSLRTRAERSQLERMHDEGYELDGRDLDDWQGRKCRITMMTSQVPVRKREPNRVAIT